jgi:hypothetical protein
MELGSKSAMYKPIDQRDLDRIQALRERWDSVTDAELTDINQYLGEGVSAYQFWLERQLASLR